MKKLLKLLFIFLPIFSFAQYEVLIVTGQSNHTWQNAAPILESILDQSELFHCTTSISPQSGEDMSVYRPVFSAYDVVVILYNGDAWSESIQDDLEDYVDGGGGLVVVHEADNSFSDWTEYNEMIGLGGWGGRNENSGPWVYLQDGKLVRDEAPGSGGMHGQQTEVTVVTLEKRHPIMKGLPKKWLHAKDELYGKLRGPAKNMTVLATAFSDPATNGSGRHEPCLMTIEYGHGKVFHTVFGHIKDAPFTAMECVGFQTTLLRGAEWVVTGKVTQKVPENFPTAKNSTRNSINLNAN